MFQFFRRNKQLTQFILFFTALTFIGGFALLTGGTDQLNFQAQNVVAEVNGEPIRSIDISREYSRMLDRMQREFGDELTPDVLKKLNLREQALQQLILREVLVQRANTIGLRAGDEEVFDTIKDIPAFKDEDGRFSATRYKSVLRNLGARMSPDVFEKSQRDSLLVSKLQDYVGSSVVVSPEEALQEFIVENTTINANILSYSPIDYVNESVATDEAKEAYYQEHLSEFDSGDTYQVSFVRLSPVQLAAKIAPTDEQLRTFFQGNLAKYEVSKEEAEADHILISTPSDNADAKAAAKAKAESIMARIKSGEDFATLAQELSDDPGSAQKGGSLGRFEKGRMVAPFENAVFSANPGDLVGPVETNFGFHIIRVTALHKPGTPEFEVVKSAVREDYIADRQNSILNEMGNDIKEKRNEGISLADIAQELDLELKQSTWYANDPLGQNDLPKELADVFTKSDFPEAGEWTQFAGIGYWIVLDSKSSSEILPFAQVESILETRVKREQAITIAAEKANDAHNRLKSGVSVEELQRTLGGELKETGPVSLNAESIPGFGSDEKLIGTIRRLTKEQPVAQTTIRVEASFFVISLKERNEVSLEEFREQENAYIGKIRGEKQKEAWDNWVQSARQVADVVIYNNAAQTM